MNALKLFLTLTFALATCFVYPTRAAAQIETQKATVGSVVNQVQIENLPTGRSLDLVLQMDPKGGSTAVTVTQNGPVTLPPTFVPPTDPNTNITYGKCKNGTVYASGNGVKVPCAGYVVLGSSPWSQPFTIDASFLAVPGSSSKTSMGTTGAGIQFQLRGFGGAGFINGNTPATSGFDGAVMFPLRNRLLVGPTAGFQWLDSSIVNSIGSQQPGSTFMHTSAGFKTGNFGGRIGFPYGAWQLGIQGGATVAGSTITQATGFCGTGGPTAPAGCTTFSSTTTHDTVTGPFVGGYISHSIFSHVGIFVGYNYHFGLKDTRPNPTNPSGPSATVLDLHYSDVIAGFNFTFGGYHEK
jgi:hypothetical protein